MPSQIEQIKSLIKEIEQHATADNWSVPISYLLAVVDCTREEYLRYWYKVYNQENRLKLASADELTSNFGPENIAVLVQFLEWQGYANAGKRFYVAGYYLSPWEEVRWLEFFQSLCLNYVNNHEINREDLEVALTGCQNFQDGAEFYCHSNFTIKELTNYALGVYFQANAVAEHSYSRHLLSYIVHKKLSTKFFLEKTLFAYACQRLKEQCHKWNIVNDFTLGKNNMDVLVNSKKIRQALKDLGLAPD